MDLQALNDGTTVSKAFLHPVCGAITAGTATVDVLNATTVDFKTIEANSLTLVEQANVPNPAVGSITLFVDSTSHMLNSQDSNGNTLPYVPISGAVMTGPLSSLTTVNLLDTDANGNLNMGSISTGFFNVLLGRDNGASGANELVFGSNCGATAQYDICIGNRCNATQFGSTSIGGGNTGITNHNTSSVAIGNDMTLGAGSNSIALGQSAGVGAVSEAIAIGYQAVNNTSNSCLLGDTGIVNVRPNNASLCDLGSPPAPFKTAWLRDAAIASGCKYSQYGSVTLTNSAVETSLLSGTSTGSLVASANATLGTIYRFKLNTVYTGTGGETLTVRLKSNGNPLLAFVVAGENVVTNGLEINFEVQVSSGGNANCSFKYLLDGILTDVNSATSAYDPTVVNTFDVTAQWSAANAGDVLLCRSAYVETLFAQ